MSALRVDGPSGDRGLLLPLVGVAAALGFWMAAENLRARVELLDQQLLAVSMQPSRNTAGLLAQAQRSAELARRDRSAVENFLQAKEPIELVQTRFLFVLRQRCQAAGVGTCVVKFSGEPAKSVGPAPNTGSASTPTSKTQTLAEKPGSEVTFEDLGLARARAVVSGTFQTREMLDFFNGLSSDVNGVWRVNSLVVRGSSFEAELEQIIRPAVRSREVY